MLPCVIHQDPSHDLCGNTEEVRPVLPDDTLLIDQLHVRLMYESSGLKRVVRAFTTEITARKPPKLVIDVGEYLVDDFLISFRQLEQHLSYFVGRLVGGFFAHV